jgi:hypothetical protein
MGNKYERDVQSIKAYIIKESKNSIESFRFEEISPLQYLSKGEQIKKLNVIINKFYEILNTGYPFVAYNFENSVFNEDNFFNTIPSVLIATEEKINIENLESNKIIKEFITEFVRAKYLEMALTKRDLILNLKTENLDLLNSTKTESGIIMYDYLFETNRQNAYTLAEKHNLSEYDRDYIRQNFWPIIKVNSYDVNTIKEKLNNLKVEFVKEYTVFDLEIFNRENTSLLIYEINQYIDILKRGKVRVWDEYGNEKFYIFKMESDIKDDTLIISDKNINQLEIYFKTILKVLQEIPNEQNTIDMLKELDAFEIFNNQFKNKITDLFNKNISKNETLNIYYKDYLPKYLTRINEIISQTEQMESDFKLNFPELKTELQNLNTITSKFKKTIFNDLETTLESVLKNDYERHLFEYLNITNKLDTDLKIEGKKISAFFEIFYNRMLHIKSNPKPREVVTETQERNTIQLLPQLKDVFFVHYQCDDFEIGTKITSLSIYADGKTIEFFKDTEAENIEKYCTKVFELCNSGLVPVHWGQNKTYFGIEHIKSRYNELTGKSIELSYTNSINLGAWLLNTYGERYVSHPRLDNLAKLNNFNGVTNKESRIFHTNRIFLLTKIYFNALNKTLKTETIQAEPDTSTVEKKIIIIKEPYSEMFSNNGFELFEHILIEYVKPKNTTGRYEDLSYHYRCLFEDKFIHQKPEPFRLWFIEKYTDEFSKIKTKTQTTSPQRKKDYSTALDWFNRQN